MPSLKLNMSWKDLHLLSPTSIASHIFSPSWEAGIRLTHQFRWKYQGGWLRPLKVFKLNCSLIGLNADPLPQGEELAAAFMGALFSVLHDTIVDARRGRIKHEARKIFDYHWSVPDVTRPTYSPAMTTMRRSDHART